MTATIRSVVIVEPGGPSWTDILAAIGTVGAVIVAVGIALLTARKSDNQLKEERRLAREREQLGQAYAVQVVMGQRQGQRDEANQWGDRLPSQTWVLSAMVVNHGSYTITRLEAQYCLNNNILTSPRRFDRFSGFVNVPANLRQGDQPSAEHALRGVLTPFDEGIRFETDLIPEEGLVNPYWLVRWTDHWGTRWEHKLGAVRQIEGSAAERRRWRIQIGRPLLRCFTR